VDAHAARVLSREGMVALVPVIFEDETLAGFRPVAWSVPVCELRCGLLNPRERVARLCGREPILLLRELLGELGRDCGHAVGSDAARQRLGDGDRLLLVSGRVGSSWDLLTEAVAAATAGQDLAWRDDAGWLVLSATGERAAALLTSHDRWLAEAEAAGCWRLAEVAAPLWQPEVEGPVRSATGAWQRIWDLVPATAAAIVDDLAQLAGEIPARRIWGAVAVDPARQPWAAAVPLADAGHGLLADVVVRGEAGVLVGPGCEVAPGVHLDAREGPIVLGAGVAVLPHSYLAGPLYVGSGSLVKAGTTIYGETSLGAVCKVGGEIGESTFLDFVNKQHEGFIGHAYVASWSNLGALTTCSDLKNTYGEIRVDLGAGPEATGQRFVGLLMGEHGKTAIGTLLNTGTTAGFASNVFGAGFPAKMLACFTWGDGRGNERQDPRRALAVARTVMARRGCRLTAGHERLFTGLGGDAGGTQR